MPAFHIINFGCRANQADGAALARELAARGWQATGDRGAAETLVLNTCTVTAAADAEARLALRRLRREHPEARIVVAGCYARRAPLEVAALAGVTSVLPILSADAIAELGGGRAAPATPPPARVATRPTVRVQDGCHRRCAYCIVPFVRGASRSLPLGRVLEEIQSLVAAGAQEVVISGTNLGQWGRDLDHRFRLGDLIGSILGQTKLPRLRLSSVEPADWSGELTALMASEPRLARHAHLPLQSGCDATLRRMRRPYTAEQYAEKLLRLRGAVPDAGIGADVMVGFPGETDLEFEQSLARVRTLPLSYAHIFRFSSRAGTEAAAFANPVPAAVAQERARAMRQAVAANRAAFLATQAGQRLKALTLVARREGETPALTGNFLQIALPRSIPPNQWVEVAIP
ncbi:MAG TPA: MiaB/RimO family radical SAM methylthiotransferase [Terriglobales bacterium]|nr:MiaB/RimO family radical SAM methylthiotransferase [Terriglobales bacterium]